MKKVLIGLFLLLISCVSLNKTKAFVLEGEGDQFSLLDVCYEKDEKFVYSATLNFDNSIDSQAGGLVFGAKDNEYYFVFNVDRHANVVKLLYFEKTDNGYNVEELYVDWYIGNDKMTESQKQMVVPEVRKNPSIELKVIITPQDEDVFAEFYADGIKRFIYGKGIDTINLKGKYVGGNIGYNTFRAKIDFQNVEYGVSDYSYYSEMYRQQYHFSQYKNWNNDPNGLVYYNGYYHLFFQHHPFSKTWGPMYWGHARSKDLVHWEQLPICVFPDMDDGHGGWAWSGSARVYHRNENPEIDKWLSEGNDSALIAFYTRDGHNSQDQIIIFSEDEGLTWQKKGVVPQSLFEGNRKMSWRDPKVFPINNGEKDIWGMVVSNMEEQTVYFLQSEDMINWSPAGTFQIFRPECVDVVTLTADDGNTFTVMLFEGREYLVGQIKYDTAKREIYFEKHDGTDVRDFIVHGLNRDDLEERKKLNEIGALKMDFAADSYATQTFYIDDQNCENYGKVIALSWFSGVPGALESAESGIFQTVRDKWNGGGFTIPVELGLVKHGDEYHLTQTPITLDNNDFTKEEIVSESNAVYTNTSNNILKDVYTHQLEIIASFDNPDKEAIEFKINIGEDEYTTVGWNKEIGYYVDRTNTSDAGVPFPLPNYHVKYSHMVDTTTPSFYILSDSGSIEVFCEDFTVPFYVLTLPSVYSKKASLEVTGDVTINELKVNQIGSVYDRGDVPSDEGVLYINKNSVRLDLDLTPQESILYFSTLKDEPVWEIVRGEGVVGFEKTKEGINLKALATGEAEIKLTCGNKEKLVTVKVDSGRVDSDITFTKEGKHGGKWYNSSEGLIGYQLSGDAYILSDELLKDCYYTARFDLTNGAAAALIIRANSTMDRYVAINYDKNAKVVKAWMPNGHHYMNTQVGDIDASDVTLSAIVEGKNVKVLLNGNHVGSFELNDYALDEGYVGLNVFSAEVVFKSITLQKTEYDYTGSKFSFKGNVSQYITKIINKTNKNTVVDKSFYTVDGRNIYINEEYFALLDEAKTYEFEIIGENSTFTISVNVENIPTIRLTNQNISAKENLNLFIGNINVKTVLINGAQYSDYSINNMILTIDSEAFKEGRNTLKINDIEIEVNVSPLNETIFKDKTIDFNILWVIIPTAVVLMAGIVAFVLIKKGGKNKCLQ